MRKLKIEELGRISVEDFKAQEKQPLVIIMDNVRSMHNVGAVLRTSDAFNVSKVYLCGITPRPPHREIRKTAIGAEDSVDWMHEEDSVKLCRKLQKEGFHIYVLEQAEGSTPLPDFERPKDQPAALVIGHEIEGVNQKILDIADVALEIPQFGTKHSLNVSVAAGVAMYQLTF
ncbi:MAG: RNA methyltransferase [Bacteroidia bacterium]